MICNVLAIGLVAASLTGCTQNNEPKTNPDSKQAAPETIVPPTTGPTRLVLAHVHAGKYGEALNNLVREFNRKQDKVYVTTKLVYGDYEGIINEELMKTELPDIFQGGHSYLSYIKNNVDIVPVQQFVEAKKMDLSDFNANLLEFGKSEDDGKLYGMPFAISTPIIYYNKDLFKQAGLDPEKPPTTFDEVRQYAKKLADAEMQGVYYNYSISGNWMMQALIEGFGGKIADTEFRFNSSEGERALQYLVDLIHSDKSMPNISESEAYGRFIYGKLGMFISTSASIKSILDTSTFEVGTAPFPTDGKNPRKVPGGGNSLYITKSTPEKEAAAWEFIKFATSAEGSVLFAQSTGYMTTSKSAVAQGGGMEQYIAANEQFQAPYDQFDDIVRWYNPPIALETKFHTILQKNVLYALTGAKSSKKALDDSLAEMSSYNK